MSSPSKPTEPEGPSIPAPGTHLVCFLPEGARFHPLDPARESVVGRAESCDVPVDMPSLSRRQFALRGGAGWTIRDLGGTNGTRLNGTRLTAHEDAPIHAGSLIECGGVFFTLRLGRAEDGSATPAEPRERTTAAAGPGVIIADPGMARLHELIGRVAASTIPVLVVGETGTGKEIVSTAIHARSPRAGGPFIRLNCAALPEALLESELFGYERGAFTGAATAKPGLLEAAHDGTLFLDEIGEMPAPTQAKLLRVLESGELMRLGSLRPRAVDVRFVAATNRSLPALLAAGTFRHDLYFRLNGVTLPIPPLRERPADIPALAAHFLAQAAARNGRAVPALPGDVIAALTAYSWPGNVRELRNVVARALVLCEGGRLRREHIVLDRVAAGPAPAAPPATAEPALREGRLLRLDPEDERRRIEQALAATGGNQGQASRLLGISRRTLVNRLNELGFARPRKRT